MRKQFTFLGLTSLFAFALLALRIWSTSSLSYIFLGWNLILAWMPLLMAVWLRSHAKDLRFSIWHIPILGMWLLFLPNAPYLVTDLIHLHPREGAPFWFDACLVSLFAWNGIMTALASSRIVHLYMIRNLGKWKSLVLITACFALCGFGIYLGRVERWNSWDLVADPIGLLHNIGQLVAHPFSHPGLIGMSLFFFLFLALAYFSTHGVHLSFKSQKNEKDPR